LRPVLQFNPSAFDNLGPLERISRRVVSDLEALWLVLRGSGAAPADGVESCEVIAQGAEVFVGSISLPAARWPDHRRAIELQLDALSPIPLASAAVAVVATEPLEPDQSHYNYVIINERRFPGAASGAGTAVELEDGRRILVRSNAAERKRRKTVGLFGAAAMVIFVGLLAGTEVAKRQFQAGQFENLRQARLSSAEVRTLQSVSLNAEEWHSLTIGGETPTPLSSVFHAIAEAGQALNSGEALRRVSYSETGIVMEFENAVSEARLLAWSGAIPPGWTLEIGEHPEQVRMVPSP